jgi:Lipid A 3-O-deacylase (PagL).
MTAAIRARRPRFRAASLLVLVAPLLVAGTVRALAAEPSGAGGTEAWGEGASALGESDFRLLDEIRGGVLAHSPGNTESGTVDLAVELLSDHLPVATGNGLLDFVLSPRLHAGAVVSTAGETSYVYAGLTWDFAITDSLFIETAFGGALNNGVDGERGRIEMGCVATFRSAAGVGYRFDDSWSIIAGVEHLSHAGLCGDDNEGLTNVGVRVGYRF